MSYIIGTDEAGYGPNLGPLVISATVWRVPSGVRGDDLYRLLASCVSPRPERLAEVADWRVAIADSKTLYQSRGGLRHLECGVLAAMALLDRRPTTWREVWEALCGRRTIHPGSLPPYPCSQPPEPASTRKEEGEDEITGSAPYSLDPVSVSEREGQSPVPPRSIPWYAGYDAAVPLDAQGAPTERLAERLLKSSPGIAALRDIPRCFDPPRPPSPEVLPAGAAPRHAYALLIEHLRERLREGLAAAGVGLVEFRSRAVFPGEFNRLVHQHGSKGAALSHATLELISGLIEPLEEPVFVECDKHGGRNRYGRLLAEHFPGAFIEIRGESRARSVYQFTFRRERLGRATQQFTFRTERVGRTSKEFGPAARRVEIRFEKGGESRLPTALASMASKYLRELAMRAFNAFWSSRVEGLRPTAGYPRDAKRFRADIAAAQAELGIDDAILWRTR